MDSAAPKSSRARLRASLTVAGIVYAAAHAFMYAGLVRNPPRDLVFVPSLPDGRVMAEFDPSALLDKSPIEYGSARFWSALVCGIFITLPPAILLVALWSYLVHAVLMIRSEERSFELGGLHFLFVFLTMFLVPVMPEEVVSGLGWKSKNGKSGPWMWLFLGPLYGPLVFVMVICASELRAHLICAGIYALMAAFYFVSILLDNWSRKNRLAPPGLSPTPPASS